jgi:hypothetical protein
MMRMFGKRLALVSILLLELSCTQPGAAVGPTPKPAAQATTTIGAPYQLAVSTMSLAVGEQLVATVMRSNVIEECSFLAYDMTLKESSDPNVHLAFNSPERLGPPAPSTGVFTLTGRLAGETSLSASVYGETTCGGVFQWTYRSSNAVTVTIKPARQAFLPSVVQ